MARDKLNNNLIIVKKPRMIPLKKELTGCL